MSCVVAVVFHKYVYGLVPPTTLKSIEPFKLSVHKGLIVVLLRVNTAGCATVELKVFTQPFVSVTVTVYVPAPRFVMSCVTAWLFHKYVSPVLALTTVKSIEPFKPPWQLTLLTTELKLVAKAGWMTLTVSYNVQPFASVTTTEYVPDKMPLKSWVVVPLFQLYA